MTTDPAGRVRLRLDVAYDGTDFSGWAAQPDRRTVQGTLEAALSTLLRVESARLTVAGRTDAGVHARGQVCHVDVPADLGVDTERLTARLARLLPGDLRVRRVVVAPPGFDARFSAVWRRYAYWICDDPPGLDPLVRRHVLAWPRRLDAGAMARAGAALVGEHDFAAFCKARDGGTTIRCLYELAWSRDGALLTGRVVADAFCHNMVRSLVGCLVAVGEGRRDETWPATVLAAGMRDPGVTVLPPTGLTLEEVGYPDDDDLAARAETARRVRTQ